MPEVVLATFNARYSHTAFGLRYLLANLGELQPRARMLEFDLRVTAEQAADRILAETPRLLGLGVYVWNAERSTELVRLLKARAPELTIVLGGPEVSHETERQELCALADYTVTGEGERAFAELCRRLLDGERPARRVIPGESTDPAQIALPYALYSDADLAQRVVYVETSRGCPFTCEFCLSSLDPAVRRFPLVTLLPEFERLLDRGLRRFKFVDRTFNLGTAHSLQVLDFFLQNLREGLFLHLEMVPDRLPSELRERLARFPPGTLQLEVGIQTFNEEVAARIRRKQDYRATEDNLRWLLQHTGAHLHADLIVGLPGETLDSFARGFDRLVALGPHEIQVNLLKRLRGVPIARHDTAFGMQYSPRPPYELMENRDLDRTTVGQLQRFARYWDLIANSGNFVDATRQVWADASPFACFMELSDALYARFGRTHALALEQLAEGLFEHLVRKPGVDARRVAATLWGDLARGGRRDMPRFLRPLLPGVAFRAGPSAASHAPPRQARHLNGARAKR